MTAAASAGDRELRDTDVDEPELARRLDRLWRTPSGVIGSLSSVDHKIIGLRYIATAFVFLGIGGVLAHGDALQLSHRRASSESRPYNQVFTMHGSNMMFLFAVPVMEAFGVYLVPLMVGTRNIAFPRLNAFSYWLYLFGGCLLWIAFVLQEGPTSAGSPTCRSHCSNTRRQAADIGRR